MLLQDKTALIVHVQLQNHMNKIMRIAHVLTFLLGILIFFSLSFLHYKPKINTPLMPHVSSNLNCTINPTFTIYFALSNSETDQEEKAYLTLLFLHVTIV